MDEKVKGTLDKTRPRGPRSQKMRALLAGGLVLGVGGAITLATWNDSEYATGTFGTGTFNMEGSINGTADADFTEHPVGTPAVLTFAVLATLLTPGDVVYAPFAVRLRAGTTNDAVVTISRYAGTTVADLTYTLIQPATFGCDATTAGVGEPLVAANTPVGTVPGTPTFALVKGTSTTAAGAPVYLCFKVTAGADIVQGQTTGTVTWKFAAVSQ